MFALVGETKANNASEALEGFAGREGVFGGRGGAFEKVDACEGGGDLFAGSAPIAIEGSAIGVQIAGILWVGSKGHDLVAEDLCVGRGVAGGGGFAGPRGPSEEVGLPIANEARSMEQGTARSEELAVE